MDVDEIGSEVLSGPEGGSTIRRRGFFVSFEGAECSGKSTQAQILATWLRSQGYSVVRTREPGGTDLGEAVRDILLAHASQMNPTTESLLFAAARSELVHEVIAPALDRGEVVICDRYIDSSLAYQGFGLGLPATQIMAINGSAIEKAMPELTVLLGYGSDLESSGQVDGPDRIEMRDDEFHRRVRRGYAYLADRYPERIVSVDTAQGIEATAMEIREIVIARLSGNARG